MVLVLGSKTVWCSTRVELICLGGLGEESPSAAGGCQCFRELTGSMTLLTLWQRARKYSTPPGVTTNHVARG